jgi:plasmid stabilization system protein ParE
MKILWTEHATACLVEIEDYIALEDPVTAQRWVAQLIQRTRVLADHPHAGRKLPEMPKGPLRELIEGNYRIVYRVTAETVEVLTVFERHRLLRGDEVLLPAKRS